ncbi:type II toxin-antitoxin system HipA family toxin [Tardiphaga sp. 866_E4_N2_1]|jgi:serine/threonine-protein kinase HipA|uniref:type II toxin-antitoxin system HipA family toxin n=1 Tax=unclassified Tardiphaga TaxID=2631404 RepID=UPI003F21B89E
MARSPKHVPLNVFVNGRLVGALRREATGAVNFRYARDWLDWDSTFPISLSLPLREDQYVGAAVLNVFDNLLPDGDAIRKRVAERVGAEGTDTYSMLAALGHDCVGALQFLPDEHTPDPAGKVDGHPVDAGDIADILNNLVSAPLGLGEDKGFRISIAGAQEKTALLKRDGRWYKPIGTTATTHILKPQIGRLPNGVDLSDSVENEYFCLRLLSALGIPSAHTEIADFGGRRTLVVERFDRLWTRDKRLLRLPQEDCLQSLSIASTRKYQSDGGPGTTEIFGLLKGSDTVEADLSHFLRAIIVFWLIGATDGHAKNFSIFLNPGGRFRMTPLYDVLSAQPSLDNGQVQRKNFKLAMSIGKSRHYGVEEVMPRHFVQSAAMAGIGASLVRSTFEDIVANTMMKAEQAIDDLPPDFPEQLVASISEAMTHRITMIEKSLSQVPS